MIWYPYQQLKTMAPPIKVTEARGVYLHTEHTKLIDSVSSWRSVIHGYHHPVLDEAIRTQLDRFAHVMLSGLTHEPAEQLSAKLEEWPTGELDYCFFSDSGSVAVEVALKMALQFYTNQGSGRNTVLSLTHAYHGDTFKAMEVGDGEDYHFAFGKKGRHPYSHKNSGAGEGFFRAWEYVLLRDRGAAAAGRGRGAEV